MGEPDCQRREDDFLFDDRQTIYDRQEAVDQICFCLGRSGGEGQSRCRCRCVSVVLARWPLLLYLGVVVLIFNVPYLLLLHACKPVWVRVIL